VTQHRHHSYATPNSPYTDNMHKVRTRANRAAASGLLTLAKQD
jgi:hypothetical protein